MTGFDSTWYHGPLAVEFFQTGNTFELHFLAPQYLAWFYPANAELFHAIGMLAFHRDILSPLLNFGWFLGCLFAAWCIGRPYRVGPVSLALGRDRAERPGAWGSGRGGSQRPRWDLLPACRRCGRRQCLGGALGPAALDRGARGGRAGGGTCRGDQARTSCPAAVVLVVGLVAIAPRGGRWRALAAAGLPALAGGGYWYLRNLAQAGNPLPWVRHLGPISLPAPAQGLGGREGHSVLEYLTDGSVWSHWFLPGLHQGLWIVWPLLGGLALAGLLLCLGPRREPTAAGDRAGRAGRRADLAARADLGRGSGGDARGFESALRYLTPALILGLALLPVTPPLQERVRRWTSLGPHWRWTAPAWARGLPRRAAAPGSGGVRLPRAAQLPAAPLRQARIHHQGPGRRLQVGKLPSPAPA